MKKIYWRPQRVSLRVMVLLSVVSVAGLVMTETFRVRKRQPFYKEKIAAARLTLKCFEALKQERAKRGIPIDPVSDPTRSGLIGMLISPVTTNTGHLPAKQTTINPNWGGVFVHLLLRAGVQRGDVVAVGPSGSFPALNTAAMAALTALKARAVIVGSVGSSQWGSNHPDFMYPDMESVLRRRGLIPFRSTAVSLGGVDDQATGLTPQGRRLLEEAIQRNGLTLFSARSVDENLDRRMALFREAAGDSEIRAYINIGGGTVSVGSTVGKRMFSPGLNRSMPRGAAGIDSIMTRFAKAGVPVIHMTQVDEIAQRYGLPAQPRTMPTVGEGKIFVQQGYSQAVAAIALGVILVLMFAFLRLDLAHRLFQSKDADAGPGRPEQMV